MGGFNAVDIVVLVWLLIGAWHGARHGLSGELWRLFAVALAAGLAWLGHAWLGRQLLAGGRLSEATAMLVAFLLLLVAVYILIQLAALLLKRVATFSFKGKLEPVGGIVLGLLISAVLVIALLFVLGRWPNEKLQRWFAADAACGRVAQKALSPLYERLAARYPGLRLPADATPPGDNDEELQAQPADTNGSAPPAVEQERPRPASATRRTSARKTTS